MTTLALSLPPITIVGPKLFRQFLEEYSQICDLGPYNFVSSHMISRNSMKLGDALCIETAPVVHAESSFACILKSSSFKILYTGDTRPTQNILLPGFECDLLIHEATFDNASTVEAIRKNHSTWDEAISIARQ